LKAAIVTEADQLNILRTDSEIRGLLEKEFDFRPLRTPAASRLFRLGADDTFELIATDASGGEFAICQSSKASGRPLLYVSSEGQAGIVACSLEEWLSTMVAIPHWHDCLKFSGGGKLDEMRRVFPFSEAEALQDSPQLESIRKKLRARLELPILTDPVHSLFAAITELSPIFSVLGSDGTPFDGLFNKFTVLSNPTWRRQISGMA
jgi:hypothetical protein